MTSRKPDLRVKEIPEIVVDPKTNKRYRKGKFLGKVGCMLELEMPPSGLICCTT